MPVNAAGPGLTGAPFPIIFQIYPLNPFRSGMIDMGPRAFNGIRFRLVLILLFILLQPAVLQAGDKIAPPTETITILALGDSLTAGFLLPAKDSFPAQLEHWLKATGHKVKVINAGVNGDTIYTGMMRLPDLLKHKPHAAIVELGANDIILKRDVETMRKVLSAGLARLKKENIPVLLAGTRAMPGQGEAYASQVKKMYEELAREYGAVYHPFFLGDVYGDAALTFPTASTPTKTA